jgi:bifunctional NMN adenylyltransferase/nudix hydrolase
MYDYAVYIGRFQPFHIGHKRVLQFANEHARKTIILVGSSNMHRSPKNPWSFEERKRFILDTAHESNMRLPLVQPINDVPYNDTAWLTQVREVVRKTIELDSYGKPAANPNGPKIVLVGFKKDDSSFYLDLFKDWDFVNVPHQYGTFNATDIRNQFFQDTPVTSEFLAMDVRRSLREFAFTDTFKWLLDEQKYLIKYREQWGPGPFNTADAVVVQSGRVLLVTRKNPPYKGALALPGGFINPKERIIDSAVRELREETRISDDRGELPAGVLKSWIRGSQLFDDPERSARGRIITNAYLFQLPEHKQYSVRGDDDAAAAGWYSLDNLNPRDFMEDHWFILQQMTGITWK